LSQQLAEEPAALPRAAEVRDRLRHGVEAREETRGQGAGAGGVGVGVGVGHAQAPVDVMPEKGDQVRWPFCLRPFSRNDPRMRKALRDFLAAEGE